MNRYISEGGMSNPNFRYKVKIKADTDLFRWCKNYDDGDNRYYPFWGAGDNDIEFQFENEQTAILFGLTFA